MRKSASKKYLIFFVLAVFFLQSFCVFKIWQNYFKKEAEPLYGANFSKPYAQSLGLDWQETYLAILDELNIKSLRLSAYWDEIEPEEGNYNFNDLDWQISEAQKRGAKIILSIGRRLPRWPECRTPEWAKNLPEKSVQEKILKMLEAIIIHYKNYENIAAWQIENEPLLSLFGECPKPSKKFLKKEVELAKALDSRPIILTESGELSTWLRTAGPADILGISLYRTVWDKNLGYIHYPLPAEYYKRRINLVRPFAKKTIITELQAEPWGPALITEMPFAEQAKSMNVKKLRYATEVAKKTSAQEIYFWGAEWWWWLKKQGDETMWNAAKKIINTN